MHGQSLLCRLPAALIAGMLGSVILGAPASAQAPDVQNVNVSLTEWEIGMDLNTASAGQTLHLTMVNAGEVEHQLRFVLGFEEPMDSEILSPGGTLEWEVTLGGAGTYQVLCPVITRGQRHTALGMATALEVV